MQNLIRISLLLACTGLFADDPKLGPDGVPQTTCPGSHMREPLRANRIQTTKYRGNGKVQNEWDLGDLSTLVEGRNLRLDCDSYPRQAGKLAEAPTLEKRGEGWHISFEITRFDDVAVRAVDADGTVLHTIACGVLGANAPAPLQQNSLTQTISWDGKDNAEQTVEGVASIEVTVGLKPTFEHFIGYRSEQLSPYLRGVTIDRKGRVYVTLHTAHRYDPSILRFDRSGKYQEMVYPSSPDNLAQQGKTFEDEYDMVEYIDGYPAMVKPSHWRAWIEHWDDFIPMPFAIGPDNKGYMIIGMPNGSGTPLSIAAKGDVDRLDVIENLDDFWYWPTKSHVGVYPPMYLQRHDAGFAFDGKGNVYIAAKPHGGSHGPQPFSAYSGTIRKVNLATGKNVPAFTQGPGNSKSTPNCLLRPRWNLSVKGKNGVKPDENSYIDAMQRRSIHHGKAMTPNSDYDSPDRFCDIEDLTVDSNGNILVADGYPRRIKCYAENGAWLGECGGLEVNGRKRMFRDLITIEAAGGHLYLLSSFQDETDSAVYLLKCSGDAPDWAVIWSTPLDPLSRYIAVDLKAEQRLVWVGNGGGPATLTRVADHGKTAGDVRHIGGFKNELAIDPATICVDEERNLYVYDKAREAVLSYDANGKQRARRDLHSNEMAHYYARYRRFPYQGKKFSIYQDGTRYFWQKVKAIVPDPGRDRIWLQYHATYPVFMGWFGSRADGKTILKPFPALEAFDHDLQKKQLDLWNPDGTKMEPRSLIRYFSGTPRSIAAVTEDGSILCRNGNNRRPRSGQFGGSIEILQTNQESATRCRLYHGAASLTVDSKGNIYTIDGPSWPEKKDSWGFRFDYAFPTISMHHWDIRTAKGDEAYSRGEETRKREFTYRDGKWKKVQESAGHIVRHPSEVAYLVKFGPAGGDRGTEKEKWALRGGFYGQVCSGCDDPLNLLACDGADRIILGDVDHSSVKVVDSAGNLIARFGRFGNAETLPGPAQSAKQLGLRNIYCVAATGDYAYICDRDLRRVAEVRMAYRESAVLPLSD